MVDVASSSPRDGVDYRGNFIPEIWSAKLNAKFD